MTCHKCGNPNSEQVRFFNGPLVRNVFVCKDHKEETIGLPWEQTSGLAWVGKGDVSGKHFVGFSAAPRTFQQHGQFQPMGQQPGGGLYVPPNWELAPIQASGTANVPTSESTGAQYQGAPYNQLKPTGSAVIGGVDFVVYVSGGSAGGVSGVISCINSTTNTLIAQGRDAYQVIQAGINQLNAPNTHLHIKPGIYILASSLTPAAGNFITGEGGWSQDTQLRASGNIPAMIISGANAVQLRDLFFVHNEAVYSGGILKLFGNTQNCLIADCSFYDFGNNTGSAIELNNGGVFVGCIYNNFNNINIFGFRDQIYLYASGGAPVSGAFVNGNQFIDVVGNGMLNSFATFKTSNTSFIDGNMFTSCIIEVLGPPGPPPNAFDYSSQMSGTSRYNKHVGVFVFDLQTNCSYATVNNNTFIDCVGCQSDNRISGGIAQQITHYSYYSDQRGYQVEDLIAYVSGIDSNVTVINPITNTVVASGLDAYQTLQAALNILPSGQELYLKKGIYHVASSLTPTAGQCIRGVAGWSQGSQIRASGNIPALIIGANNITVSDLFFVHNETTFSGGVLKFQGTTNNCLVENCTFYDFGQNKGSCIELNNGGVFAGPTYNQINNCFLFGFQDEILFNVSGGAAVSGAYANGNQFSNIQGNSMNGTFCMFRTGTTNHVDANTFTSCQLEVLTNATAMFDYNTQFSGFSYNNKHIGVVVLDIGANGVYASVNPVIPQRIQIDMVACQTDIKISGSLATINGNLQHYGGYVDQKGSSTITSSGVGTTSWFITCSGLGVIGTQGTPNWVQVTPANSGTASLGGPFVTNANISGFTVNSTAAAASGLALSWYWRAAV